MADADASTLEPASAVSRMPGLITACHGSAVLKSSRSPLDQTHDPSSLLSPTLLRRASMLGTRGAQLLPQRGQRPGRIAFSGLGPKLWKAGEARRGPPTICTAVQQSIGSAPEHRQWAAETLNYPIRSFVDHFELREGVSYRFVSLREHCWLISGRALRILWLHSRHWPDMPSQSRGSARRPSSLREHPYPEALNPKP